MATDASVLTTSEAVPEVTSNALATADGLSTETPSAAPDLVSRFLKSLGESPLQYALPILTLCGLAVFGLLRQAYAVFYDRLGASPSELGFGYGETLALSAAGVALTILVALPFVIALIMLVCARRRSHRLRLSGTQTTLLLTYVVLATTFTLLFVWPVRPTATTPIAALLLSSSTLVAGIAWQKRCDLKSVVRRLPVWVVVFVVVDMLVGWCMLLVRTDFEASRAYEGRAVHAVSVLGSPVLALRAEPSHIAWLGPQPAGVAPLPSHCVLYLGEGGGVGVFFDPKNHSIARVPIASLVVTSQGAESC